MGRESESFQTLKTSARATSKFKILEPTRLADLMKHRPGQYDEIPDDDLENLSEGDFVKIAFIHKEDMWIVVDSVDIEGDLEKGTVYGKTCEQAMKLHSLQKGQRVCFDVRCVCAIKYHSSDDDDDEEEEDDD